MKREVERRAPYGAEPDKVMRDLFNEIDLGQRLDGEVNNLQRIPNRLLWGGRFRRPLTRVAKSRVKFFEKMVDFDGTPLGGPRYAEKDLNVPKAPYVGTSGVEFSSPSQPESQGPRPETGEQKTPESPVYPAVFR